MIPEGWEEKRLEEIATLERGRFSPRPRNDPRYFGGAYPFVQTGDVVNAQKYIRTFQQTLNEDGLKVSKIFPENTILITIAANIGDTALTQFPTACTDSLVGIISNQKTDAEWLYYFLQSQKELLDDLAPQNAQKNINLQVLRPLSILLPPLKEQIKIAEILTTWDDALETLEKLIAAKQELKRGLMQELLTGKKRFKEFEGREWSFENLKNATNLLKDGTHGTHTSFAEGIPLLSAKDINSGKITFDSPRYISEEDFEKIQKGYKISPGDILLTVVGSIGRAAIVNELVRFSVQRSVAILRPKSSFDTNFMYQVISGERFTRLLEARSNASAQAGVYLGELAKLIIPKISLEEQIRIATVLSTLDTEISTLQNQHTQLQTQKKGLMQKLLTGKIRVKT